MNYPILKYAALNALGTALYIAMLVSMIFYSPKVFGSGLERIPVLAPITMLLLFVLSATVTASLVLGRPILWYLEGKKKEAVSLLIATISFLFVLTLSIFTISIAIS